MKIYTGNFANVRKYRECGYLPISIARYNKYFHGIVMHELSPSPEMMKEKPESYIPKFHKILNRTTPDEILTKLKRIAGNQDVVLLCYEKEGLFCHRHIVAEWLAKGLNIVVKELGKMEQPKKLPLQKDLF